MHLIAAPSPNYDARAAPPDMVVVHYTGMPTGDEALARLRDPAAKVSAHYLIEEDGRAFALVPEARRAWHAGVSFWKGERNLNGVSIGVELVNPGHDLGYRPFPDAQIAPLVELLAGIRERWDVSDARIVGHSDVAPDRKIDPGELFPWKRLAEAGFGLWVEPAPAPGARLKIGEESTAVFALQAGLTRLGYDCAPSGRYDETTAQTI